MYFFEKINSNEMKQFLVQSEIEEAPDDIFYLKDA